MEGTHNQSRSAALIIEGFHLKKSIDMLAGVGSKVDYASLKATLEKRLSVEILEVQQFDFLSYEEGISPAYKQMKRQIKSLGYKVQNTPVKKHDRIVTCPCPCRTRHKVTMASRGSAAVSISLALSKLLYAKSVTDVIIVTGDSILVETFEWFKERGLRIWVLSFSESCSVDIISTVGTNFVRIEELWKSFVTERNAR